MRRLFFSAAMLLISSCASVQSVSLTQIPAERKDPIEASVSRFIFLGFNFDNDYVDKLASDLRSKCRNGKVSGILTKDEVFSYFIAHKRVVTARGYCIK